MEHLPARTMRPRGIERLNRLLDATERLMEERANEDVSLAQIAEAAGVPLPSAYHFFPNRNAAFEALALRFNEEIYRRSIQPLTDPEPQTWQELLEDEARRRRGVPEQPASGIAAVPQRWRQRRDPQFRFQQ